jgi:hypothetical protein
MTRREAIGALLTVLPVAALPAGLVARSPVASSSRPGKPSAGSGSRRSSSPVERVFVDLTPGTMLGACSVVRVAPIVAGGVPVTLRAPGGVEFDVDVVRHDDVTPGVARAGALAVFMKNGGKGSTSTIEEHGLGAMALASWLERREALGFPVPSLMTLRQRAPLLASTLRG